MKIHSERLGPPTLKIAGIALFVVALALVLWFKFYSSPSLESAARRDLGCKEAGNAGCLLGYMLPEEISAQSVTKEKLDRLLKEYVLPNLVEFRSSSPSETVVPLREQGELTLTQRWTRNSRPPAEMSADMVATADGAKEPNLVRGLIFLTMLSKYRRSADEHQILSWIRGMGADGRLLTGLGFDGIYDPDTKAVIDWVTLRSNFIQKAKDHGMAAELSN